MLLNILWMGSFNPYLLKEGNPLVSTLIPLFLSLSLCPRTLFYLHTVCNVLLSVSQVMVSSCPTTFPFPGLDRSLVTYRNLTHHRFLNLLLLLISWIMFRLVFFISKLPLTFPLVSHILKLLFLAEIYQTSSTLLTKRSPSVHVHWAAPLNQYILQHPGVNLLRILLCSRQYLPQAFAVSVKWSLYSFFLCCLHSHLWLFQTEPFDLPIVPCLDSVPSLRLFSLHPHLL